MGERLAKPHDRFFKLLLDDPAAAAALLRERLPPEVAALLTDDPPETVRGTLVDEKLRVLPARVRGTVDGACYRGGVGRRIASAYTPGARGADEARA